MTSDSCRGIRVWLGPFNDGELTGAERLRVSRHVEACASCRQTLDELVGVGDLLRDSAGVDVSVVDSVGFAQGIVSRSRAEASLSWPTRLHRACGDWHWVVVGAGSLAATVVSMLALSALLAFGPEPARQDSLAGFIGTLESPRGDVIVQIGPDLLQQDLRLVSVRGSGDADASVIWRKPRTLRAGQFSAVYGPDDEAAFVGQLAMLATWDRPHDGPSGAALLERSQEDLLDEITRLRLAETRSIRNDVRRLPTATYVWR